MGEAGRRKRGEGEGREGGDGVTEVHGGQRLQAYSDHMEGCAQVLKQTLHSFRNHTVILTDLKMVHVLLQVLFHLLSKQ